MTKKQVNFAATSTQYAFWAPSEEVCEDVLMPCKESKNECDEACESSIATKTEDGSVNGALVPNECDEACESIIATKTEDNECDEACEEGESIIVTNTEDGPVNGAVLDTIIQMIQMTREQKKYTCQRVVDHFKSQDKNTVLRLLAKIMRTLKRKEKYSFVKHQMCIQATTWEPVFKFWITALKCAQEKSSS